MQAAPQKKVTLESSIRARAGDKKSHKVWLKTFGTLSHFEYVWMQPPRVVGMVKFTIIIPTFNSERTLDACLASLASQRYKNFEVLIMDGNSTDKTSQIVQMYARKIPGLRFISERDKGIYDAMNKGITLATGSWLCFLGSDDTLYSPSVLQDIAPILNQNADIVYGNINSSRFNGVYGGAFSKTRIFFENICHQAIFFKKDIFSRTGLFNLRYKAQADWDHNMKWLLDPKIRSIYADLIIANYADGGYSSVHGDNVFQEEKMFLYLQYARKSVSLFSRFKMYAGYQKRNIKNRSYKLFFRYLFGAFEAFFKSPG